MNRGCVFGVLFASLWFASADEPGTKLAMAPPPASQRWNDLDRAEEPSYRRHVIPLLSRVGCSGRECHGSFAGQGGFQLSLFGYDFEKDHKEITDDADGGEAEVRVSLEEPEKSLLLLKPTLQMKHKGKERIQKNNWEYKLLLKWIASGAKNDAVKTGEFDRLEVFPNEVIFGGVSESVQLRVLAHWKDGTIEDVTQLTRFRSNDDSVVTVSEMGRVECKTKGDTHVVAFYDNGVVPVPVLLPFTDEHGSRYPEIVARTKIDAAVVAKLRKLGIVPSELCADAEFLRRVSLDLTGTLPTPADIKEFLGDNSADKRAAKIEQLLQSPAYAAWWTTKLCDFTGNSSRSLNNGAGLVRNVGGDMSRQWYRWIYQRVADNKPYDQIASGIILATSRTSPAQRYEEFAADMASYFRRDDPADFATSPSMPYYWQRRNVQKPEEKALAFSHSFLGARIECAQCHKHPFDQWTKTDFEQFQAFFTPIAFRQRPSADGEEVTYQSLMNQIREKITENLADKAGDKMQEQRALQNEVARRREAGELVPWPEVFADNRRNRPMKNERQAARGNARVLTPKILGGEEVMLQQYNDPREPLMNWLRDKDNSYFAKAFVNRVWANYFNRGLVHPADDMNLANPPVNKELLDYLSDGFVARHYDMKWLHREILNSDTYQRSWKTTPSNKLDEKNFSHATFRRLPAEVMVDAIAMATASENRNATFSTLIDQRAIGPLGNSSYAGGGGDGKRVDGTYALGIFGKPARETNCDCERATDPTLLQTLYTRNDPEFLASLEGARKDQSGWIAELRRAYGSRSLESDALAARKTREFQEKQMLKKSMAEGIQKQRRVGSNDEAELGGEKAHFQKARESKSEFEKPRTAEPPKKQIDSDQIITTVFLRTVSRPPAAEEVQQAKTDIAAAKDPIDGVRDLLWALLNTREFQVNH